MGIIWWMIFGLIVGLVARFLMPGRDSAGLFMTMSLGVLGAVIGGFVGRAAGWYREGEPTGFLMAVLGSIILLILFRMFRRPAAPVVH